MKRAFAIHHGTNYAPGVRGFSDRAFAERRVLRAGGSLADLHESGGVWIYWPPSLGPFPAEAQLQAWDAAYDAAEAARPKTLADQIVALPPQERAKIKAALA